MKAQRSRNRIFADLTAYMKRSPRLRVYLAPVAIYLVVTFLVFRSLQLTFFLYALPVIFLIAADHIFVTLSKFYFPPRRIFFLNFSTFTVFSIIVWILFFLKLPAGTEYGAIMFSWSTVSFLRVILYYPYYSGSPLKLFLPSIFPILIVSGISISVNPAYYYVLPSMIAGSIFYLFGFIFVYVSIRDFRKEFGVSPIKILNMFLNMKTDEDHAGLDFFRMIYSNEKEVPVKVISLARNGKSTVRMVFPYVHPGPFGKFGSSNLPEKLTGYLSTPKDQLMVFHTATTNSNNCRDEEDVKMIAEAVRDSIEKSVELHGVSRFKKLGVSGVSLGIQRFGDMPLVSFIPDRERFDDVSYEDGMILSDTLVQSGTSDTILIDSQSYFFHGAPILSDLQRFRQSILREHNRLELHKGIVAGYGNVKFSSPGIGPMGVQALVIGDGKSQHCYVLTDSNNITTEQIDSIRKEVPQQITSMEFYTTDNHVVNSSTLDMNPLGERDDLLFVRDHALEALRIAIKDIGEANVFYGSSKAKVHMGEEDVFKRLNSTVFKAVKTAKYAIFATSIASLLLSGLVFLVLSKVI